MTKASRKSNRLRPTEIKVIVVLQQQAEENQTVFTKKELSELCGCNIKTADRAITELRKLGIVKTHMRFDDNGGQLASAYELVPKKLAAFLPQIQAKLMLETKGD